MCFGLERDPLLPPRPPLPRLSLLRLERSRLRLFLVKSDFCIPLCNLRIAANWSSEVRFLKFMLRIACLVALDSVVSSFMLLIVVAIAKTSLSDNFHPSRSIVSCRFLISVINFCHLFLDRSY